MFLNRVRNALKRGESGLAFIAVVAVMAIGLVVLAIVTGVLTSSFVFSSVDRADTQAQAAADSGVSVAIAGLNTPNNCDGVSGVYVGSGNPRYRATIWRSADGVTFIQGCPNSVTSQVRIISTGYPAQGTLTGVTAGTTKYLEATYFYSPNGVNTAGVAASYIYNIGTLDKYVIQSVSGGNADLMVKTGDFSCSGPTTINGNVLVAAGNASLTNTCVVTGTVWATGTISMSSQSGIKGNAISSGSSVTISNSTSYVSGSVYANGSVSTNGSIGGNIEAVGSVTTASGSSVSGNIWSGSTVTLGDNYAGAVNAVGQVTVGTGTKMTGTIVTAGSIKYTNKTNVPAINAMLSAGVITSASQIAYNASGITAPTPQPAPVVPGWADVVYNLADWQAQGFNNLITWPSALGCSLGNSSSTDPSGALYPYYQMLQNLTVKTVVDMRGCNSVSGSMTLSLKTDIAFFAQDYSWNTLGITSADGTLHKLWFIVPEIPPLQSGTPDCPRGNTGNFTVNNPSNATPTSLIGQNVTATVYTPCTISMSNSLIWRGLLYSGATGGGTTFGNPPSQLYFTPIGIPGTQVGNGNINPSNNNVGALVLKRNRTNNGE